MPQEWFDNGGLVCALGTAFAAALVASSWNAFGMSGAAGAPPRLGEVSVGEPAVDVPGAARRGGLGQPSAQPVLYGADDRIEPWEVVDAALAEAARAACLVAYPWEVAYDAEAGAYELLAGTWTRVFGVPVCEDERFRGQAVLGDCSAFLVTPDIVVTAGHCVDSFDQAGDRVFVFGFEIDPSTGASPETVGEDAVYFLDSIIARQLVGATDYAVVRLDRPVVGVNPVRVRGVGEAAVGTELVMVGHPIGLPKKVTPGATVRQNTLSLPHFEADLDAYGGNSGSMVLNAETLEVEGILVRGNADFTYAGSCYRSRVLDPNGISTEDVTRASVWAGVLPETDVVVAGPARVVHAGPAGGPFAPGSQSYTITNPAGGQELAWSAVIEGGMTADFVSIEGDTEGVLLPGASATVTTRVVTAKSATAPGIVRASELVITHGQAGGQAGGQVGGQMGERAVFEHRLVAGQPTAHAAAVPVAIPDMGVGEAAVFVSAPNELYSVEVDLRVDHSFIGDLTIELVAPTGEVLLLHNQTGGSADVVTGRFGDGGLPAIGAAFSTLEGVPMGGWWRLRVSDGAAGDSGAITMFSVRLRGLATGEPYSRSDLAVPLGYLDSRDINAFVGGFFARDVGVADLNGDGVINASDINAFVTGFLAFGGG
ncbi:MAG: trypsin-like peptidase domain-containing protein [Planctomycetota bacterium]